MLEWVYSPAETHKELQARWTKSYLGHDVTQDIYFTGQVIAS